MTEMALMRERTPQQDHSRIGAKRILATMLLAVGIALSFMSFLSDNAERISRQNEEYLADLTAQRAISVDNLIAENLNFVESTAYLYGNGLDSPLPDIDIIRAFEENSVFDMLRFVDADGDNYTSKGRQANLSDRVYFQRGMRGESGITFVQQSRVTGQRQIGFYTPVYYEDQIIGVMVGFYGEEYVSRLLTFGLFGHGGEGWLVASDGTIIGTTSESSETDFYRLLTEERLKDDEVARIAKGFQDRESVTFSCPVQGEMTTAFAVPLEQTDWMLIRSFPPTANSEMLNNANHEGVLLLTKLLSLFAVYVLFLAVDSVIQRRRTAEANRKAHDISTGVSRLFNAFVALDLDDNTYEYIGGDADTYPGIPPEGDYGLIVDDILSRIPAGEEEHRAEVARAFDAESLRAALMDTDRISVRVHAPSNAGAWYTFSFVVIQRADAVPVRLLVTLQDVTELNEREEHEQQLLQDALDVAESASRAKTEFLFNMSHDLRTPMNAIIGYTELAQREGVTPDEMRTFIRKIDSSSLHLLALINDILEMSRIESGKMTLAPEECDLAQIVNEARSLFSNQMREKGITFVVDASSSVTDRWVLCDQNRLNRILLNLISNAYKFTDRGGTVTVTLSEDAVEGNNGHYTLSVRDTGIGMSPEFVERLFTPFERERTSTVSRTQGTGLGLSITKKIVDLMGGSIEVLTEQGKGTEFVVRLSFPIVEHEDAGPVERSAHRAEEVDFTGTHILLVEDQQVNLEIASMLLTHYGFVLDTATNGQEALDKVAASQPGDYEVILMDIQMPVMDGYTAARRIRALEDRRLASIPIVAMTANAFQEDVQAARDAGMDGHIAKPIDVGRMLYTLADVLGR